jgi:serine/threonine protein kinase
MTPERWQRLATLFAAAQECPVEKYAAFLDRACSDDPDMRAELESLLQPHVEADDFLEQPAIRFLKLRHTIEGYSSEQRRPKFPNRENTSLTWPDLKVAAEHKISAAVDLIRNKLGRYEVIARVGAGGMGVVYKARDKLLGRLVAIKVLPPAKEAHNEHKLRLIEEARIASALNHPNIVTTYEIGEASNGTPYIVMEYIDGQPVRQMIANGTLTLESTLAIAAQIAEGLSAAHERGVLHRDLKPENVVVDAKGLVKILDFGIAKLASAEAALDQRTAFIDTTGVTNSGMILGTANYMSPEQAGGKTVDFRTDQFSLGVMLYEMLTSKRPFERPDAIETLAAVRRAEPPAITQFNPEVPRSLQAIVTRCLAKDPAQRYNLTVELALELTLVSDRLTQAYAKRRKLLFSVAIALILASVMGLLVTFSSRRAAPAHAFYSAVPLTTYPGSEISPSFAPDGQRVAFAWDGEKQDNFDIYVKQIGGAEPFRLTTDPKPDLSPAWSPDGRTIAFLRLLSPEKADLLLMNSLTSGPVRRLTDVVAPGAVHAVLKSLAWSPNGKWLVVSDAHSPGSAGGGVGPTRGLYLVSVETGERRRLTLPSTGYDDLDPEFSPEMSRLVFARYSGGWASDLYMVSLSKDLYPQGEPKRLTFYNRRIGTPVWTPDARGLLFARYASPSTRGLWRMILSNPPKMDPLPLAADNSSALALSTKTNRLVYTRETSGANIWGVEMTGSPRGGNFKKTPKLWISSSAEQTNPQFSPDRRNVAFQSSRSGHLEIWLADRDGSHPRQLTEMRAAVTGFPRWSPDGNKIVFHSRPAGAASLFVVDIRGGRPKPLTDELGNNEAPSWSHDGQWIYFASLRTADMQVWKIPAKGGRAIQVTTQGGWAPLESADSKYLFYTKTGHGLWRLPLAGGEERQVLADVGAWGSAYAVGKRGIYFIGRINHPKGQELAFFCFATGRITPLVAISQPLQLGLAVSPDEHLVLYSQLDNGGSNLMLVDNFR